MALEVVGGRGGQNAAVDRLLRSYRGAEVLIGGQSN
jgi:hypothetical protein